MKNSKVVQNTTQERPISLSVRSNSNQPFLDSDNSLKSPNSVSSSSNRRICTFVRDRAGYGFKITGNAPVKVKDVRLNGSSWNAGLRENDIILKVNGRDVKDWQHKDVVALIRKQEKLELSVRNDENISNYVASHIPTKPSPTYSSAPIKRISKEIKKEPVNHNAHSAPTSIKLNLPVPRKTSNEPQVSQNSLSDTSRRSTESNDKLSESEDSECSISTSSSEFSSPSKKIDQGKSNIPKPIIVQSTTVKKSPPEPPTKPKIIENTTNHSTFTQSQILKVEHSPGKDYPIKSHSYNASVQNQSAKILQNIKKGPEKPRHKTIPLDTAKSTNMLHNDRDKNELKGNQMSYSTLPKKLPSSKPNYPVQKMKTFSNDTNLIMGRDYDDDDDDKGNEESSNSLSIIDLMSYPTEVLSRPGLVSILIIHGNEQTNDLNTLMLYYACRFYGNILSKHDFKGEPPVLANEIITTFLLEKSPLYVPVGVDVVEDILKKLKSSDAMQKLFEPILPFLNERLQGVIDNVKGKIQRGTLLQSDLPKLDNVENKDVEMTSLHKTVLNICNKSHKDGDAHDSIMAKLIGLATIFQYFQNPSLSQNSSMRSRSSDGLNTLGLQNKQSTIAEIFKINIFFNTYQQKLTSSLRKKFKSISGHNMTEAVCKEPVVCSVCENLLWGPSPQGLFCAYCQNYCHMNCKKKVKQCVRKSRKSTQILGNKEDTNASDETIGVFKAKSEDQLHRIASNSDRYPASHDNSSLSYHNSIDSSNMGTYIHESSTVQVSDLVQDESLNDPDMKVDESFDAGTEIQKTFPNIEEDVDKKRIIVLLEFYHKTRYILMNLKKYHYKLVKHWPSDQVLYFRALSLDCIEPFVLLIKSLVTTIEKCIAEQDFVDLEKAVYNWLSEDNDKNLKTWISLSSNLCCTNSLYLVKQLRQTTMRAVPDLIKLLTVKMHKIVLVEELTQIRPLLISLPLIVKNIIKCLLKYDQQYLDQLNGWKEVSIKMDYLCEYIDRCCVPLVDWVNNGCITKRLDKTDHLIRIIENEKFDIDFTNFFLDFPRTLFHFTIMDFKMAKIFTWSRNTKRGSNDYPTNYFIKGAEVLLIFYQGFILVLQKENDHYYLKPGKPGKNVTERIVPIIETSKYMVTNGGQEEDYYLLNIINKKDATLIRVGFTRKEFADNCLEYFGNNYDLARYISIYKLNDIKLTVSNSLSESNLNLPSIKLRSSESFSSHPTSAMSPPLPSILPEIQSPENLSMDKQTVDNESVPQEIETPTTDLVDGLDKVLSLLSDQKKELCKFINIQEDQYDSSLQDIITQSPGSLKEMALMLYSLCGPTVALTRLLIMADSSSSNSISSSDIKGEIKKTICCFSNLLRNMDSVNEVPLHPIEAKIECNPIDGRLLENTLSDIDNQLDDSTPTAVIKEIISDIIEQSVDQIEIPPEPVMRSYKYMPDKCQISNNRNNTERSTINLIPTYQPSKLIDETITTTRAQITLNRNSLTASSNM